MKTIKCFKYETHTRERVKKLLKIRGFTLIELLVVISIIGFLATASMVVFNSARAKSRDARRISDLKQISTALELYFDANGYYPQSGCGWDCNGYRYSTDAGWDALQTDLAPYISRLPKDPINNVEQPWVDGRYSYAYGNVGRYTMRVQYDLTAQLENTSSPLRCGVKNYLFYFDNRAWCLAFGGNYSNQIYEASLF